MKRTLALLTCLLVMLGLSACSTPESRIRKNPELFDSFAPEAQERIRAGQVDVGFTQEMVEMALDTPDRIYRRATADGSIEVWSYVENQIDYTQELVRGTFQVKDGDGRIHTVHDDVWVTVQHKTEYESRRIEFDGEGKVVGIESLEQ